MYTCSSKHDFPSENIGCETLGVFPSQYIMTSVAYSSKKCNGGTATQWTKKTRRDALQEFVN